LVTFSREATRWGQIIVAHHLVNDPYRVDVYMCFLSQAFWLGFKNESYILGYADQEANEDAPSNIALRLGT
jgi:hypothetical protein